MKVKVVAVAPSPASTDAEVFFAWRRRDALAGVDAGAGPWGRLTALYPGFSGEEGERLLHLGEPAGRNLLLGLGTEPFQRDTFRRAGGNIVAALGKSGAVRLVVHLPACAVPVADMVECLVEGVILSGYRFDRFRSKKEDREPSIAELVLVGETGREANGALRRGSRSAEAVNHARDFANTPANHLTPRHFAATAAEIAEDTGLALRVLERKQMQRLGMGGLLAVSQGSAEPARLIALEYRSGRKVPTLLLVGKGLTFDSGGISLKPGAGMEDMKYDMCGGAAVLMAMAAIGREKPRRIDVVGVVPATENMPGPAALKPGDVVTVCNGRTVEVVNTDAEGRLILADALAWGVKTFRPDAVVDVATLTGAVVIALGHHYAGMMSNDDALAGRVDLAAARAGEPVWRLPLGPEYAKLLKSDVADLRNVGKKREAGAIVGGAFLQEFVDGLPWVHLDIAGTAWEFPERSYMPKGASGVGVRTLLELVRSW